MKLSDKKIIFAPKKKVWIALNDPDVLKDCIDGCDEIIKNNDNEFYISIIAKVGPVKAKFKGEIQITNIVEESSYKLHFNASGGQAGFGKGTAEVKISDDNGSTVLEYSASASIGGKLAQIGSRLVDGVAKKLANSFFEKFESNFKKPNEEKTSISNKKFKPKFNILWLAFVTFFFAILCYIFWVTSI